MHRPHPVHFVRDWFDGRHTVARWWRGSGIRLHLAFYSLFFGLLSLSLFLQPDRWASGTRAYTFLLRVAPGHSAIWSAHGWAILLAIVAAIKAIAAIRYPRLAVTAITLGSVICATWAVVFVVAFIAAPPEAAPFAALFSLAVLVAHLQALARLDLRREEAITKGDIEAVP